MNTQDELTELRQEVTRLRLLTKTKETEISKLRTELACIKGEFYGNDGSHAPLNQSDESEVIKSG